MILAARYNVEPEELEQVADTNILPTYEEVQEAIETKRERQESVTRIVPPSTWNLKLGGRTKDRILSQIIQYFISNSSKALTRKVNSINY